MFSDKYKEETEQLTLDDEFLVKLKQNMRNERERLQQVNANDETSATTELKPSKDFEVSHRWKHTLPVALTACAAIALIALFPNIFSNFISKKDDAVTFNTFETANSLNAGSLQSAVTEEADNFSTSESIAMDSTDTSTECTEEADSDCKEAAIEDSFVESAPALGQQNTLQATTTDGYEELGGPNDILYEDGIWSFTDNQEFIPSSLELLESLQQSFTNQMSTDVTPSIDYADNGILVFHDDYGFVIFDYETESIKRLVDLPARIGDFITTGEEALELRFYNSGNYIFLDPHRTDDTGSSIGFLYEVATDTMIQMTTDTFDNFDMKADDLPSYTGTDSFASYINLQDASSQAIQFEDDKECILYYSSSEDSLETSLSIYEVIKDNDGNVLSTIDLPVYSNLME